MLLPKRWSKESILVSSPTQTKALQEPTRTKRPLSPHTLQSFKRAKVVVTDQMSTMSRSIERGFLHTLEHMKSETNQIVPTTLNHSALYAVLNLYIKEQQQQIPTQPETMLTSSLPILHKAYEDEALLKPRSTDQLCRHGDQCEGFLMAVADDLVPDEMGFQCKALQYPNSPPQQDQACLLCIRKEVSLAFYNARVATCAPCVQPHRNIIGCEGEYRADSVLYPTYMDGITDPFVAHERHHYKYTEEGIVQINVSFFEPPPRTLIALHASEEQVQCILGGLCNSPDIFCPLAQTMASFHIDESSAYRLRIYYAYRYLNNDPSHQQILYLQLFIDYQSSHMYPIEPFHYGMFQDVVHVLSFLNFFRVNPYMDIPLVHILTKSLPQRCQFRNMRTICLQYCRQHHSIWTWMRRCVYASLCGYYPHTQTFPPYRVRLLIQQSLWTLTMEEWEQWVERHPFLLFQCIKEFLVVLMKWNIGLHTMLRRIYHWDDFEQKCLAAMDVVRSKLCINRKRLDVFHGLNDEIQHFLRVQPLQVYKINKKNKEDQLYERLTSNLQLNDSLRKIIHNIVFYQHCLPNITEYKWLQCIGLSARGQYLYRHWQNKSLHCSPYDTALLKEYVTVKRISQQIRVLDLPRHWYTSQYRSLRLQYECDDDDPLDDHAGVYFVCTVCKTFKSCRLNDRHCSEKCIGHSKVCYDIENDQVYCTQKKFHRHANVELVSIQMLGKLLYCYHKCYVLCPQPNCARPTKFDFRHVGPHGYACDFCRTRPPRPLPICAFCNRPAPSPAQHITLDNQTAYLCAQHAIHDTSENWTKASLHQTIQDQTTRRYG